MHVQYLTVVTNPVENIPNVRVRSILKFATRPCSNPRNHALLVELLFARNESSTLNRQSCRRRAALNHCDPNSSA